MFCSKCVPPHFLKQRPGVGWQPPGALLLASQHYFISHPSKPLKQMGHGISLRKLDSTRARYQIRIHYQTACCYFSAQLLQLFLRSRAGAEEPEFDCSVNNLKLISSEGGIWINRCKRTRGMQWFFSLNNGQAHFCFHSVSSCLLPVLRGGASLSCWDIVDL